MFLFDGIEVFFIFCTDVLNSLDSNTAPMKVSIIGLENKITLTFTNPSTQVDALEEEVRIIVN